MAEARLIEVTELPDLGVEVGLIFIQGAGFRVGARTLDGLMHMAPAAARRLAKDYEAGEHATELAPAVDALRAAADKLDALEFPLGSA